MAFTDIDHFFVLMLENRSYDHMLGALNLTGVDPDGNSTSAEGLDPAQSNKDSHGTSYATGGAAPLVMPKDPPHEYDDVRLQLLGANGPTDNYDTKPISKSGFVQSYEPVAAGAPLGQVMTSFRPSDVPILAGLAKQFCTCDRWFSSLPGATIPNRLFLLAGSSNGDPKSPSNFSILRSFLGDQITFQNGTIFKRIKQKTKLKFVVYRGSDFPLAQLVEGVDLKDIKPFDPQSFAKACNSATLPEFILIEPTYGITTGYRSGNSQHPVGSIVAGERLIKTVYEAIRNSACWSKSVLIITYDEHGGFFDHVTPPSGFPAPGDVPPKYHFDFTQLGVRVPAVVISPLIKPNTIDHTVYDHTSILATLRRRFPEIGWFTERDRLANDLKHLFTRSPSELSDAPAKLATVPAAIVPGADVGAAADDGAEHVGHSEAVFLQIAAHVRTRHGKASRDTVHSEIASIKTKDDARAYLKRVAPTTPGTKREKAGKGKPVRKKKRKA